MTFQLHELKNTGFKLDDISFIKKHLRFQLNSIKRLLPFIFFVLSLCVFATALYLTMNWGELNKRSSIPFYFFLISMVTMSKGLHAYWQSLHFERVPACIEAPLNIIELQRFFKKNQLYYFHPEGRPEVFLINSREDYRNKESEIVIFIAVDKAILVNSHISTKNIFPSSKRRFEALIKMLVDDLKQDSSSDVSCQS